ncbi:hypothetical protein EBS43_08415 [bacterium]|nr:hypothetical protein [bacterium]
MKIRTQPAHKGKCRSAKIIIFSLDFCQVLEEATTRAHPSQENRLSRYCLHSKNNVHHPESIRLHQLTEFTPVSPYLRRLTVPQESDNSLRA